MVLALSLSVAPLNSSEAYEWEATPQGPVVVHQGDIWVLYSATLIRCPADGKKLPDEIILTSDRGYCYLVDPQPIGYYESDPNDPKNVGLPLISLIERTYK